MDEKTYDELMKDGEEWLYPACRAMSGGAPGAAQADASIAITYILLAKEKREAAQTETTSAKSGKEWYRVLGSNPRKGE